MIPVLCRDCMALETFEAMPERCRECGSPRLLGHAELADLAIAHIDCDAFYATVEKRDRPEIAEQRSSSAAARAASCWRAVMWRGSTVSARRCDVQGIGACPDAS